MVVKSKKKNFRKKKTLKVYRGGTAPNRKLTHWNNNNTDRIEGLRLEALRNRNRNSNRNRNPAKNKYNVNNVNNQGYSKLLSNENEPEPEPKPKPNEYDLVDI
jgi:hypothetical protein